MKNYKLPLMGFALVLLITTSCKKEDVQQLNTSKTTSASSGNKGSWNSLSTWSTVKADSSTTTYFSNLSDTAISADVVQSGLVLVFRKTASAIESLPFQDKSTGTYWYYQVSKNLLRIDGNNKVSGQNADGQAFSYFVFTPQQISNLEAKGKTRLDLMQLSYDQAVALFK